MWFNKYGMLIVTSEWKFRGEIVEKWFDQPKNEKGVMTTVQKAYIKNLIKIYLDHTKISIFIMLLQLLKKHFFYIYLFKINIVLLLNYKKKNSVTIS